jgi:DNA (cytosine-5)-methyltransferase 1
MPTVTGAHRGEIGIVEPFMVPFYGERPGQDPRSHGTGDPVPTIPASGHGKFGLIEPFILHQDAPGAPRRISDPVPTIRARNGHGLVEPFLIHYYGNGGAEPVRVPIGTVTTHDRFGLVNGTAGLDITFRMLQPHELAAAQGFPDDYWFAGTKTDQVKQIGNAVPVNIARALATAGLGAA